MITDKELDKLRVFSQDNLTSLELDECFLTPELEKQKQNVKNGDVITVYRVIEIRPNGNIVYMPVYQEVKFTI